MMVNFTIMCMRVYKLELRKSFTKKYLKNYLSFLLYTAYLDTFHFYGLNVQTCNNMTHNIQTWNCVSLMAIDQISHRLLFMSLVWMSIQVLAVWRLECAQRSICARWWRLSKCPSSFHPDTVGSHLGSVFHKCLHTWLLRFVLLKLNSFPLCGRRTPMRLETSTNSPRPLLAELI